MNFGDKILVSASLIRFQGMGIRQAKREWQRLEYSKPCAGFYIGYRTLANGYMKGLGDYSFRWVPKKYIQAALVVLNERENPVYAFFEDIKVIEEPIDKRCTVHSVRTGQHCRNLVDMEITAVFKKGINRIDEI